ncbi:MAG: ribonuclease-3 [Pseudohongiellaceae bacterium]
MSSESLNIDYIFKNHALLKLALSHCSSGQDNNERLEFLGDSILGFFIAEELYRRFPEGREGQLSRIRADLVQRSTLAGIARELALGSSLNLGSGELKSGGADRDSILADALEALISAIYLDAGLETCRNTVLGWFERRLAILDLDTQTKDAKTRLQEHLQAIKSGLPEYDVLEVAGKDHQQTFAVLCRVDLLPEPVTGYGTTRRDAEQEAADAVLKALSL